eukprot:scaffold234198_cov21-Prasinocladus_malaysianus.AAC.1
MNHITRLGSNRIAMLYIMALSIRELATVNMVAITPIMHSDVQFLMGQKALAIANWVLKEHGEVFLVLGWKGGRATACHLVDSSRMCVAVAP